MVLTPPGVEIPAIPYIRTCKDISYRPVTCGLYQALRLASSYKGATASIASHCRNTGSFFRGLYTVILGIVISQCKDPY